MRLKIFKTLDIAITTNAQNRQTGVFLKSYRPRMMNVLFKICYFCSCFFVKQGFKQRHLIITDYFAIANGKKSRQTGNLQ